MATRAILVVLAAQAALVAAGADVRLIKSIRSKDVTAVRALIKQRVDVNAAQGDGATALHWAAHVGSCGAERRVHDEHAHDRKPHPHNDRIFASTRPVLSPNLSITMPK